ncbi:hypothetical protein CEUSTIGMA_g4714.t1 [Chlamydomonas eustigma]|uniref:GHMP kinase N-terminal domain-containing protein n=1 Tax=Chlamydomonas eustigma TaxID=1157962 RepID=A0A250X2H7_9CHLO|nr:hypothetical protein CEUSTIGMA_g4714.t1 [Chlamydomonas eustigma]|eukprot:GAX77268.1 hypothetical protein CEUSTIGMA_g4714.t1 [Chlamydomonas eustigma]
MNSNMHFEDDHSEDVELFVSGRLCLFGEHSDWAGEYRLHNPEIPTGKTLVVGTQEGLYARANRDLEKKVLAFTSITHDGEIQGTKQFPLEEAALLAVAQEGRFWSYIAGTVYRLIISHDIPCGIVINNYKTTLPMGKGLSSSAAVCVMVARAFNKVFDLKLTTRGEMEFAYLGEITTPSKCGRMDQACAFGSVPVLMTFDADILHIEKVALKGSLYLVLVDLKASKDTTVILKSLQGAYPIPRDEAEERLHDLLGGMNQEIVGGALQALTQGDVETLGALMKKAQTEFDCRAGPICPSQLTAPVLHKVLAYPALQSLIWGGKGVGSQGDGTAQLLCKGLQQQHQVCDILETDLRLSCMPLTVHASSASSC